MQITKFIELHKNQILTGIKSQMVEKFVSLVPFSVKVAFPKLPQFCQMVGA